jgi:hypothetical protein
MTKDRPMRLTGILTAFALLALGGCATPEQAALEYDNQVAYVRDQYAEAIGGIPFQRGAVSVLATEHGELRTYSLTPCKGGAAVCAGGMNGRAGQLTRLRDYHVVSEAYRGRVFYLAVNGTGYLRVNGQVIPLAWE